MVFVLLTIISLEPTWLQCLAGRCQKNTWEIEEGHSKSLAHHTTIIPAQAKGEHHLSTSKTDFLGRQETCFKRNGSIHFNQLSSNACLKASQQAPYEPCNCLQAPLRDCTQTGAMNCFMKEKLLRDLYTHVHCGIICNIREAENNPNIHWQTGKHSMV